MRAIGIAIPFFRRRSGVPIDAQAQAHFNRVIADGGVVPSGLSGVNAFFSAVKAIYGTTDINTAISAAYDAHYLGYKLGAGSGTTLGQAAQKLYSVKSTENLLLQSGTLSSASWIKEGSTTVTSGQADPNGGTSAWLVNFGAGQGLFQAVTVISGQVYFRKLKIRGTAGQTITLSDGNHSGSINTITFTGNWQTITTPAYTAPNTGGGIYLYRAGGNTATSCTIFEPQLMSNSESLYIETTTTASPFADVVQTTAASQPLLLAHTGENYWWGSGVAGNGLSTPHTAANNITGNMSITANIFVDSFASNQTLYAKWGSTSQLGIDIRTDRSLIINYRTNDGLSRNVTTSANFLSLGSNSITITRNVATGKWFVNNVDLGGVALPLITSNDIVTISGFTNAFITQQISGKIFRLRVWNNDTQTGTPVVDFNPASYNPSVSQTQWTSATGEVWSLNVGTATSGYKGVLVDRTIVQGDGVDDTFGGISINIQTVYNARRLFTNSGSGAIAHLYTNSTRYLERRVNGFSIFNGTYLNSLLANNINLNYIMGQYNSSNSIISVNNSADIVGNSGSTAPSGTFNVFNVGNHTLNTFVCTNALDAALQRTAMYNYIRSINGNSF